MPVRCPIPELGGGLGRLLLGVLDGGSVRCGCAATSTEAGEREGRSGDVVVGGVAAGEDEGHQGEPKQCRPALVGGFPQPGLLAGVTVMSMLTGSSPPSVQPRRRRYSSAIAERQPAHSNRRLVTPCGALRVSGVSSTMGVIYRMCSPRNPAAELQADRHRRHRRPLPDFATSGS